MQITNTIQMQETNMLLSKIAEGIADLMQSIYAEKGCEILSNLKYAQTGIKLLERDYINQYGGGVISLKDFDRRDLSQTEAEDYKKTLERYKCYKEIVEEMERIINQRVSDKAEDDTVFAKIKTAYKRWRNKRYLKRLEQAFSADADAALHMLES